MSGHSHIKAGSGCEIYRFEGPNLEKFWLTSPSQSSNIIEGNQKIWINIQNHTHQEWIEAIQNRYKIHPLILEDIQHSSQQPKIEFFEDMVFITLKMIYSMDQKLDHIKTERISILFGENYLITFQEKPEDIFDLIRVRLENPQGKMRRLGTDYFAYTLLDTIIDQYYQILEIII
ncbi:MAG: CorA family divalent cation transporter, partial [Cyclobacteriaceae bacterium]